MSDLLDLWGLLTTGTGWFQAKRPGGPEYWCDGSQAAPFTRACDRLAWLGDASVNAVPYLREREVLYHGSSSVLWARCESGRQVANLRRFKVRPTLVLREGDTVRHTAFWALSEPLDPVRVDRANRRIAHWLGSPKKYCDVGFRFAPPGAILRWRFHHEGPAVVKRRRQVPVLVRPYGGSGEAYAWGAVVGHLRDAPDPREGFLRRVGRA